MNCFIIVFTTASCVVVKLFILNRQATAELLNQKERGNTECPTESQILTRKL